MKAISMRAALALAALIAVPMIALPQTKPATTAAPAAAFTKQALTAAQVPPVVTQALKAKFPDIKKVDWSVKSAKNYEAEFLVKGSEVAAKFNAAGEWLETESAIPPAAVPKAVMNVVATAFKGYKVVETQNMLRRNETAVIYELHVENAKEIVKAIFSADGSILSQSAKPVAAKAPTTAGK